MGWLTESKIKHSSLGLCKILTKCNVNLKTIYSSLWQLFKWKDKFEQLKLKGHKPI